MEDSTYGFWYDFARYFIIPTMVPLITALIAIFGVWYTIRTNTNHSNKLREEARKKSYQKKTKINIII